MQRWIKARPTPPPVAEVKALLKLVRFEHLERSFIHQTVRPDAIMARLMDEAGAADVLFDLLLPLAADRPGRGRARSGAGKVTFQVMTVLAGRTFPGFGMTGKRCTPFAKVIRAFHVEHARQASAFPGGGSACSFRFEYDGAPCGEDDTLKDIMVTWEDDSDGHHHACMPIPIVCIVEHATITEDDMARVLAFFHDSGAEDEDGCSLADAVAACAGLSLETVRWHVQSLVREGKLYSTIDEDHYQSTEPM